MGCLCCCCYIGALSLSAGATRMVGNAMSEVNVVAEIREKRHVSIYNPNRDWLTWKPIFNSDLTRWADHVERLEAREAVAGKLIKDLETPLYNIPLGPDEALVARVEAYLNPQTGDTL